MDRLHYLTLAKKSNANNNRKSYLLNQLANQVKQLLSVKHAVAQQVNINNSNIHLPQPSMNTHNSNWCYTEQEQEQEQDPEKLQQQLQKLQQEQEKIQQEQEKIQQEHEKIHQEYEKIQQEREKIQQEQEKIHQEQEKIHQEQEKIHQEYEKHEKIHQELQQQLEKHHTEKPSNPLSSINNITLYQVVDSLNAFKKSIYNVNYVIYLINKYKDDIVKENQYASTIKPIVDKQYIDMDHCFWINGITHDLGFENYFSSNKPHHNNLRLKEIKDEYTMKGLEQYNLTLDLTIKSVYNYATNLKKTYPNTDSHYYFSVLPWQKSLVLRFNYFTKDLLNKTEVFSIGAAIDLIPFIPNTNDLDNFSPEYLKFINHLADEISVLNGDDWQTDAIWPYRDPVNFPVLTCLYSRLYPEWNGKLISECFIPGSEFDVPSMMYGIMVDLWFNYPKLIPGQIALVTYNILDKYYVSLVKIDKFTDSNGLTQLCFKQKQIEINAYFSNLVSTISSDTLIKGSFNVQTYDRENIIKTDNIAKVTTFNNKVGINQDVCDVKGLLDIDNLSNNSVLNILHDFVNPLLYSYEVTMALKDEVVYGQTTPINIPLSYSKNVFVFKAPIQNKINDTDISFLHTPSTAFSSKKIDQVSFAKIQKLINELNKMQPEMDLNDETKSFIFSFVELLNDTNNYYLTSLRGIIKRDPLNLNREIYFVGSFLDVSDKMINNSYKKNMNALTDKFSSCSKLLNLGNLIILDPLIQENLLNGQSISSSTDANSPFFSDRINNSPFFRDRFGSKEPYIYCIETLNNVETDSQTRFLFNELYPYFNAKQMNSLLQPNTDILLDTLNKLIFQQFNNLYGSDKEFLTFCVNYDWTRGRKIAFDTIISIKNKKYRIGCGFNLSDVLDEAIVSKGDNIITGNLTILDDVTNVPVFNVNREKKQTTISYHTGIGTLNPKTMLDIRDCGITDILRIVNDMATQYNMLNDNMKGFIDALTNSENDAVNYIDTNFKNQDINKYIYSVKIPNNFDVQESKFVYHWLYPQWNGIAFNELLNNNKNDQQAVVFAKNKYENLFNNNNFYNECNLINVISWVAGIKICLEKNIHINDNFYSIGTGINLQQYVSYESNDNIRKFFDCIKSYNYQLQEIVIRYKQLQQSEILNYTKAADVRNQFATKFPIQNLVQYTIDFNDISNMSFVNLDYNTLIPINSIKYYKDIKDENTLTKLMFLFTNLKSKYGTINKDDYGVIAYEDVYKDFMSLFWCPKVSSTGIITLISLELQLDSIIIPSLKLKGDMSVNGDAYFSSKDNSNTYAHIDPGSKFFGINTLQNITNYAETYKTTTNGTFSKNNVIISSKSYPNTIIERFAETATKSTSFSKNYSTLSTRRSSNLYTFQEMYDNSKLYTTPNDHGLQNCFGTTINTYKYGPDITSEIKDVTNVVKEIGNIHIVVDNIEPGEDGKVTLRAGFGVAVIDPLSDGTSREREILYVNNNSRMSVNSIMLGGHLLEVDADGNLCFDGQKMALIPKTPVNPEQNTTTTTSQIINQSGSFLLEEIEQSEQFELFNNSNNKISGDNTTQWSGDIKFD